MAGVFEDLVFVRGEQVVHEGFLAEEVVEIEVPAQSLDAGGEPGGVADHDHDLHVECAGEPFGAEEGDGVFEQGPFSGETGEMAGEPVFNEAAAVARGADAREVVPERVLHLYGAPQAGLIL
ncbi:MAG: hypothetical protein ACOX5J_10450 [Candidatus Hydrogenedentales bacterium]